MFEFKATNSAGSFSTRTKWQDAKYQLVRKMNWVEEYCALGLKFENGKPHVRSSGKASCHAFFRADERASAYIDTKDGSYHDSGDKATPDLSFWDFAQHALGLKSFFETLEYYSKKHGVDYRQGNKNSKDGSRIEDSYFYSDEHGNIVYVVDKIRLENGKKNFRQTPFLDGRRVYRRTDAQGNPIGLMEGIKRYPYRLPELLRSREAPVWIVEGEKDVDRLCCLGYVATTNSQGSQATDSIWPQIAEWLRGRDVIIVPDNDAPGLKHARRVGEILAGVANSILYAHCLTRDLPKGGDVSDWLDQNGDASLFSCVPQFTTTLEVPGDTEEPATEEPKPEQEERLDATLLDLADLTDADLWVWPNWIPKGQISIVAAPGGIGKTTFCLDLFRRIRAGLTWPDGTTIDLHRDSKILIIPADYNHAEIKINCRRFGISLDSVFLNTTPKDPHGGCLLASPDDYQQLRERIHRIKPLFVVIDTIGASTPLNLDSSQDANNVYRPLQEIAVETGTAFICISHTNNSGGVLGKRGTDKARVVILMTPSEDEPNRLRVEVSKSWAKKPDPLGCIRGEGGQLEYDGVVVPKLPAPKEDRRTTREKENIAKAHEMKVEEICRAVLAGLDNGPYPMTYTEIQNIGTELGGRDRTISNAIDRMIDNRDIVTCQHEGKVAYRRLVKEIKVI